MFQPFVLAVMNGNCDVYGVTPNPNSGVGCIQLPAELQSNWLSGTVALISISLVFQIFDMVILTLVRSHQRWRGAKMQRPWFSMFTGILVLVIIAIFGVFNATRLPRGVTETV